MYGVGSRQYVIKYVADSAPPTMSCITITQAISCSTFLPGSGLVSVLAWDRDQVSVLAWDQVNL